MIEVTNAMIEAIKEYGELVNKSPEELAKRIIELHEQSKPKSKPVGVFIPKINGDWEYYGRADEYFDEDVAIPLYRNPPTREPLSEEDRNKIKRKLYGIEVDFNFDELVDEIEKAHKIGVEL